MAYYIDLKIERQEGKYTLVVGFSEKSAILGSGKWLILQK